MNDEPVKTVGRLLLRAVFVAGTALALQACMAYPPRTVVSYGVGHAQMIGSEVALTLVNDTPQPVCSVHMAPVGQRLWGYERLGPSEVILPGDQRTFYVVRREIFDVQAQRCGGGVVHTSQPLQAAVPSTLPVSGLVYGADRAAAGPDAPASRESLPGGTSADADVSVQRGGGDGSPGTPVEIHASAHASGNGDAFWRSGQANASAQVVINNAPDRASEYDVLGLRDGSLVRGHVAEVRPSSMVTLVLLTGEARTFAWGDIASAQGPSFAPRVAAP